MEPKYEIRTEPSKQLVRLRLTGHWDQSALKAYGRDLAAAMREFEAKGGRPGEYLLLVDLRDHPVQPKDVAAGQQAIIAEHAPSARRRALVMSESALHAMQVRRISSSAEVNIFRNESEAEAWLSS